MEGTFGAFEIAMLHLAAAFEEVRLLIFGIHGAAGGLATDPRQRDDCDQDGQKSTHQPHAIARCPHWQQAVVNNRKPA